MYIRFSLIIIIFCLNLTYSIGQIDITGENELELKIKQVENNLAGSIQIENRPISKWTLPERMAHYHTNGVSISVIKDYKIEWTKNYGWADFEEKKPVTTSTRFQAASNSKSINAIGVLKLVQEGKIKLNEDINTYLKTWKFPYDSLSNNKKITIANLLSHTAGLSTHGFIGYKIGDTLPTISQILDGQFPANSQAVRSEFEPSDHFNYSGGGTLISQLIIQDVTGLSYEEYMWKNVLEPLGMINSTFTQPIAKTNELQLASGYLDNGKRIENKYNIYPEQAAAGLWTTSQDLAKYIIETQLSLLGKSNKILSQKMTKLMLTPYLDRESALGVFVMNKKGTKYFNHGGTNEGFVSQYIGSFEDGNGVVVMTNTLNPPLYEEIVNSVANTYKWKNFTPDIRQVINLPDSIIQKYIGNYQIESDTLKIVKKQDGIYIDNLKENSSWKMYFLDYTNFFVLEDRIRFQFKTDKNIVLILNGWELNKIE